MLELCRIFLFFLQQGWQVWNFHSGNNVVQCESTKRYQYASGEIQGFPRTIPKLNIDFGSTHLHFFSEKIPAFNNIFNDDAFVKCKFLL